MRKKLLSKLLAVLVFGITLGLALPPNAALAAPGGGDKNDHPSAVDNRWNASSNQSQQSLKRAESSKEI